LFCFWILFLAELDREIFTAFARWRPGKKFRNAAPRRQLSSTPLSAGSRIRAADCRDDTAATARGFDFRRMAAKRKSNEA